MNKFSTAFASRIITANDKNASETNVKKLQKMQRLVSNERLASLLESCNINADRFSRAIYASEKVVKFAQQAIDNSEKLNEVTYAIFRSAMNCAKHEVTFTRDDARCSMSRDLKAHADKESILYRLQKIYDEKTIVAQHQSSIDALLTLNILQATDKSDTFKVNVNELAIALCDKFEIEYELAA